MEANEMKKLTMAFGEIKMVGMKKYGLVYYH